MSAPITASLAETTQAEGSQEVDWKPIQPPRTYKSLRNETEVQKLSKRLYRQVGQAIADFDMVQPNDRIMVCMSGGKDSYALLDLLEGLRKRAPVPFSLIAVNLDQGHPGFPSEVLPTYLGERGFDFHIEQQDTHSIVKRVIPEGQTTCSLCSRLRRGILYRLATELKATKIALGHHRDDILQTFLLNLFHGGSLKSMPPKLRSDNGQHIVIRPLAYVEEEDLEAWAIQRAFPIIPCDLCGSQENLQRQQIKALLRDWDKKHPGRIDSMFKALGNVKPSHLLDHALFNFHDLPTAQDPE